MDQETQTTAKTQYFLKAFHETRWPVLLCASIGAPFLWISGVPVYWVLIVIIGFYGLVAILSPLAARAQRRRAMELLEAIGTLEISDSEVQYVRDGRRQQVRWCDIESVVYAESCFGTFGEDEWTLRVRSDAGWPMTIPDYPSLREPFLQWCAKKLQGFDAEVYDKAVRAGTFKNYGNREPVLLECWDRDKDTHEV